ncbi:hypothetical protein SK128_008914 [Halocaridina rubra]|uniref:HAUS augmin-like complex subunit 1 n=1 Tax=Halocaridina rubra TaxID=373956 RepID=A0AAN8WUF7_HALRR
MDMKHKEVIEWLREVYGEEKIQSYEKSECSINILHGLMMESKRTEHQGKILMADFTRKASEYNAEAQQMKKWRETARLEPTILSSDSQISLSALAHSTKILDVLIPTSTNIILAMNNLEMDHMQVTNNQEQEKSRIAFVLEMKKTLAKKLQEIQEIYKQAEALHKLTQEELSKDAQCKAFSLAKSKNYAADISNYEAKLSQVGLTREITHGNITKEWTRLLELEKQAHVLKKQLNNYTLPPDMALAEIKVQEARQELANIVEGLADKCNVNAL